MKNLIKYLITVQIFFTIVTANVFSNENENKKRRYKNLSSFNTYVSGGTSVLDSTSPSFDLKAQFGGGIGANVLFRASRGLIGPGAEILYMFKSNTVSNYYYEPYYAIDLFVDAGVKLRISRPYISFIAGGGIKHMNSSYSSSTVPEVRGELLVTQVIKNSIGFSVFYVHTFHPDFNAFETIGLKIIRTWVKKK